MLARLIGGREERLVRDPGWDLWASGGDFASGNTWAGVQVTEAGARAILTVHACTALITELISSLPIDVYTGKGQNKREVAPPSWWDQPNPETDLPTFVAQIVHTLLLDGNDFTLPIRNDLGRVVEAWNLDPTRVTVNRRRAGGPRVYEIDGQVWTKELLHAVGRTPWPDQLRGFSPVEAARQTLGLAQGSLEHGARFFGQGAEVSIAIEQPGPFNKENAKAMAEGFAKRHGGSRRSHLPAMLYGGATIKQLSLTNEQAQFLETRKFTAAEIAGQMFLIDPSELGIPIEGATLNYQNVESRGIRLARVTLLPWISRVERVLTYLLPRPQWARINVDGLMRADLSTRMSAYATGIPIGVYTTNEARELEDRPPLPDDEIPDSTPAEQPVDQMDGGDDAE